MQMDGITSRTVVHSQSRSLLVGRAGHPPLSALSVAIRAGVGPPIALACRLSLAARGGGG